MKLKSHLLLSLLLCFTIFIFFFAILGYSRILRDPSGIFQDSSSADHPWNRKKSSGVFKYLFRILDKLNLPETSLRIGFEIENWNFFKKKTKKNQNFCMASFILQNQLGRFHKQRAISWTQPQTVESIWFQPKRISIGCLWRLSAQWMAKNLQKNQGRNLSR